MIQTIVHIIGYDIWFYISHLALHTPNFYWIHKEHHTKYKPVWLDTYHGHSLESLIQGVGFFLPFLFGLADLKEAITALIVINVKGMMRHDSRTAWLIDGGHHLMHHKNPSQSFGEPWMDAVVELCMGNQRSL